MKVLLMNSLTPFYMVDKNGAIVYANKRAKGEFEGSKGFLVGEKIDNVVSGIRRTIFTGKIQFTVRLNIRRG